MEERAQKVHKRAADKLDKFFEAKMKYGRTGCPKDAGDSQANYGIALEGSWQQSRQQNTEELHGGSSTDRDIYNLMNLR